MSSCFTIYVSTLVHPQAITLCLITQYKEKTYIIDDYIVWPLKKYSMYNPVYFLVWGIKRWTLPLSLED